MKTSVVVAALILAFSSAQASEIGSAVIKSNVISEDVSSSFAGLSAVEIPAKAAKIVKAASVETRFGNSQIDSRGGSQPPSSVGSADDRQYRESCSRNSTTRCFLGRGHGSSIR